MTAAHDSSPRVTGRVGFAFAPGGRHLASLAVTADGHVLELWTVGERVRRMAVAGACSPSTVLQPRDDGSVLVADRVGDGVRVSLVRLADRMVSRLVLGVVAAAPAYYLLPAGRPGEVGLLVTIDGAHSSTVWSVGGPRDGLGAVLRLPGILSGGSRLTPDSRVLAFDLREGGAPANGIAVDLGLRSWRRIWSLSEASTEKVSLCDPASGVLVVSSTVSGEERIGVARLGEPAVDFPEELAPRTGPRRALALQESTGRVLVHEADGVVSRLFCYTPGARGLRPVPVPRGVVVPPARWSADRVTVPFSCPTRLVEPRTFRLDGAGSGEAEAEQGLCHPAGLTALPGAAGPIEAVTYGDPLSADSVVVALHGGPLSATRWEFDPRWQALAGAGIAVVAPNHRGSVGYGPAHRDAVLGSWGGPDLADVRAIGRHLARARAARGRAAPVVFGVSYGGYLALLAACTESATWSGCVALAPFTSAAALAAEAGEPVRRRVAALAGGRPSGPDVLEVCRTLAVPLLLVHGTADERVPVAQSRRLVRALGADPAHPVDYREIEADHLGVIRDWTSGLTEAVVSFCRAPAGAMVPG